jgi:uncharacterized membrane protein YhdT
MQRTRTIGIETSILFVAALASFIVAAYKPEWARTAFTFCAIFFVLACIILAITIIKRRKTRIG